MTFTLSQEAGGTKVPLRRLVEELEVAGGSEENQPALLQVSEFPYGWGPGILCYFATTF